MKAELKRDAINEMLEELGKAVTSGDLAGVSKLYAYPVLLISDGGGRVLKKPAELEALFAERRDWYNIAQGMTEARGKLEKIEQLAEQTAAINVRWLGYDSKGHEKYREKWYYIVQNLEGVPRIRVSMTLTK